MAQSSPSKKLKYSKDLDTDQEIIKIIYEVKNVQDLKKPNKKPNKKRQKRLTFRKYHNNPKKNKANNKANQEPHKTIINPYTDPIFGELNYLPDAHMKYVPMIGTTGPTEFFITMAQLEEGFYTDTTLSNDKCLEEIDRLVFDALGISPLLAY